MAHQLTGERPATDTGQGHADTRHGDSDPVPAWFASAVFGNLPRSDQRRCATAYLRALLTSPGRKTVRAMANSTTDLQALQQFVNASPWDWRPARRALGRLAAERMNLRATVLDLALVPKYGEQIVGVHRRPTPTGGSVNCQVSLGMFLTERGRSLPVDWRLYLNRAWGEDKAHRQRARVPDGVRRRPLEELALELLDEAPEPRRGRTPPVILDLRGTGDTCRAAAGLLDRGADFLLSLGEAERRRANLLKPPVRGPLVTLASPARLALPGYGAGRFRLLTEWSPARDRPRQVWLTNILDGASNDFLALLRLRNTSGGALTAISEDYGMADFTGRSFPGWNHHMTLVSAAYAVDTLELGEEDVP
ncbi:transposase [Streptomyces sp. NBC_00572]|uniref:IS701 family transposase n=1 Tax=Streptomyces sp. NBC_00572 TaxID=2903664 RepID=UPI00225992C4|nr:transposase [Streptomyces sp. NBC_00572]MCX4987074.1 transposase [Streptomyces sp. NBC_00572]